MPAFIILLDYYDSINHLNTPVFIMIILIPIPILRIIFSFIYNEDFNKWELSPAYDLTYSYSINGEHATTINGNGVNLSLNDILKVAEKIGLDKKKAKKIASEIEEIVKKDLEIFLI